MAQARRAAGLSPTCMPVPMFNFLVRQLHTGRVHATKVRLSPKERVVRMAILIAECHQLMARSQLLSCQCLDLVDSNGVRYFRVCTLPTSQECTDISWDTHDLWRLPVMESVTALPSQRGWSHIHACFRILMLVHGVVLTCRHRFVQNDRRNRIARDGEGYRLTIRSGLLQVTTRCGLDCILPVPCSTRLIISAAPRMCDDCVLWLAYNVWVFGVNSVPVSESSAVSECILISRPVCSMGNLTDRSTACASVTMT